MSNKKYGMSFTTGGLFHRESVEVATLYLDLGDWSSVRDKVIAENLLQTRAMSTLKRNCREITSRLKMLNSDEIRLLIDGDSQEQAYLLWISVCRRYSFIADFSVEVLRERYLTLKTDLTHEDFDSFFNQKAEWHDELDTLTPATVGKLRQVLFKILREAGLLTTDCIINNATLSSRLLSVVGGRNSRDLSYFPIFESDLKRMTQ